MDKNIFSGLEKLGFDDIHDINLYETNNTPQNATTSTTKAEINEEDCLYDRQISCPICGNSFSAKTVKTSSYKMNSKDSDFFIRYDVINPYFYDVWICNNCGYASMKADFNKVRNYQIEPIKKNISAKWKGRNYKLPYSLDTAIERYKLSLLNSYYMEAKSSRKAMNCLKLAWMYRLKEDISFEKKYLAQALKGFNDAYYNEDFPIYGMNRYTNMYLIGELNRRIDNTQEALIWYGKVITSQGVNRRLKDLARDQKDLIKSTQNKDTQLSSQDEKEATKSKGFFSSLFKK